MSLANARNLAIWLTAGLMLVTSPAVQASPERWKYEGWSKTDFTKTKIKFREILSGGPPKDGIPSIDKPIFKPIGEITNIADNAPVIGLTVNGTARAYPLSILMWHEIVNDTIAGVPVTVTYCPLCNAAIVFNRKVGGRVLDFGTTGKLRNSDLVMYDRQTESWWQQFTGEAIVGSYLGTELEILPSRLEGFAQFRERNPSAEVLVPNNPGMRNYGRNPYVKYDSAARPFLYRGSMPDGISPMARVVVVRQAGASHAISMQLLREKKAMTFHGVMLKWQPGQASALDTSDIAKGREVGTITAQQRNAAGDLVDVAYDVTFAFVFHAFNPKAPIVTQ